MQKLNLGFEWRMYNLRSELQHQQQWWCSTKVGHLAQLAVTVKDYYADLTIENMWVLTFFTPVSLESSFTEARCVLNGLPASSSDTRCLTALSCQKRSATLDQSVAPLSAVGIKPFTHLWNRRGTFYWRISHHSTSRGFLPCSRRSRRRTL